MLPPGRARHPSFVVPGELYLGSFIPAPDPKLPPAISVEPLTAPHAVIDQTTGRFTFANVPPGTYALVLVSFSSSYVFEKPNGGGRVDVRVQADQTTNLGEVVLQ